MKNLVHALMLGTAVADITLSRTIDSHAAGNFNVVVEGTACKDKDDFGSNTCDLNWGQSYTVDYSASLTNDIVDGDTVTLDAKLDGVVPFKFTCNLCGQPCTVTVPIIKQTFTIDMPACPIKATSLKDTITVALPASSPVPLKVGFTGTVTANSADGTELAKIEATGNVDPSAVTIEAQKFVRPNMLRGEVQHRFMVDLDAGSHYGDPNVGCESDEKAVQITGVSGSVCTPSCTSGACPTDVPEGVTASPTCALQDPQGNKYCVLLCQPSVEDDQCGDKASCKAIQGVGVCTYDSR